MSAEAIAFVWDLELSEPEDRLALLWLANNSGGLGYPVSPEWISLGVFMTVGYERACEVLHDLTERGLLRWGGAEDAPMSYVYIVHPGDYYHEPIDWTAESKSRTKRVAALIERDGGSCTYCGCTPVIYEVDHFIPRAKGGADRMDNLVLSCGPCNRAKRDKLPEEFLADRSKLLRQIVATLGACSIEL